MATPTVLDEPTRTGDGGGRPQALSPRELARWAWRQLTSMRTALLLLLLLALGSVPGSVVPQSNIASNEVARWREQHPDLAPVYDKLGLFSVYDSPWFSAIYLLLMVSLIGCIVPRTFVYWRSLRATPPAAPKNLGRLPAYVAVESDEPPDALLERAVSVLRSRRYRVVPPVVSTSSPTDRPHKVVGPVETSSISAERGRLREAGNLLFHISVIVVLVGFAGGQLLGYKGGTIVMVGNGFSNSVTQYDEFSNGSLLDPQDLPPLNLNVDDFDVHFLTSGPHRGQPVDFGADITYTPEPGAQARPYRLAVNHPLVLDGVSVFLVGHGYAPVFTVRDGRGQVAYKGPVTFLPQDPSFASFGVLKVPDARPEQLGFEGMFFPTYAFTMERGPFSIFPDAHRPVVSLLAYHGDLGMDTGAPQSVYDLDTSHMAKFKKADGKDFRIDLSPGRSVRLPNGAGTVRFDGWQRWVKLQVSNSPGKGIALSGMALALVGLMGSLFIRRRRAWVRVSRRDGRSYVEVAGLDRTGNTEGLSDEVQQLADGVVPGGVVDTGSRPPSRGSTTEEER